MAKTLEQAEKEARKLVDDWATGALLTGWIPGSSFFHSGADILVMRQVGEIFGVSMFDEKAAIQTITNTAASVISGSIITEAVGLVPVFGWAVKSGLLSAKAKVLGDSVVAYFRELSDLPSEADMPQAKSTPEKPTKSGKIEIEIDEDDD